LSNSHLLVDKYWKSVEANNNKNKTKKNNSENSINNNSRSNVSDNKETKNHKKDKNEHQEIQNIRAKPKPNRTLPTFDVKNISDAVDDNDNNLIKNESNEIEKQNTKYSMANDNKGLEDNNKNSKSEHRKSFQSSPIQNKQRLDELAHVINTCGKDKVFDYVRYILNQGTYEQKNSLMSCFQNIDKQ